MKPNTFIFFLLKLLLLNFIIRFYINFFIELLYYSVLKGGSLNQNSY